MPGIRRDCYGCCEDCARRGAPLSHSGRGDIIAVEGMAVMAVEGMALATGVLRLTA